MPEHAQHGAVVWQMSANCWQTSANFATLHGADRLVKAAVAVQRYAGAVAAVGLDDHERRNLTVSGTAVVDMAAEFGYSERSLYRELRRLFDALRAGLPLTSG